MWEIRTSGGPKAGQVPNIPSLILRLDRVSGGSSRPLMRSIGEDAWRAVSGAVNDAIGTVGEFVSDNQAETRAADAGLVDAMFAGISILRGNDLAKRRPVLAWR